MSYLKIKNNAQVGTPLINLMPNNIVFKTMCFHIVVIDDYLFLF